MSFRKVWGLALLVAGFAAVAVAQRTTAEITGAVTSQDGFPLPGVSVIATPDAGGQPRQTVTDETGNYVLASLPVGSYSIRAELPNFNSEVREGIVVQVARPQRLDFMLTVGQISSQITIVEDTPLTDTVDATMGDLIPNSRVMSLPLNGRRYADLLLVSDNLVTPPGGTRGGALQQTGPSVAVAGQRAGHNMYFLDGTSVTDQYFNNLMVAPPIDSIQEFNIQKSIYPAEYGGKASATISAATKSGTNQIHGTLYEFFRNSAMDARNFFNGPKVPPLRQNQFGGTVGGPVIRDKTFFFATAEGLRERRALTQTFSLPTAAVRGGDFTGLGTIYDPYSTNPNGTRVPFVDNKIPVTRLDPVAQAFLNKVPLPNLNQTQAQNFAAAPSSTNDISQFAVKLDHTLSPSDTLYARYSRAQFGNFLPFGSSALNQSLIPGFGTYLNTLSSNGVIGHTHVFSPNWLHDLRIGFLRADGGQSLQNQGVPFAQQAGLSGVSTDPTKMGYPAIDLSGGYSSMGDPSSVVSRNNTSLDIFSNTTYIRGAHTVKFGAYFFHLNFNPTDAPNARGNFQFTPRYTSSVAGLGDGNAFADFLLGTPSSAQTGIGLGHENAHTNWLHLYAQDDWRATHNLTFNIGLRYEANTQLADSQNRLSNIQPGRFVIASGANGQIDPSANQLLSQIPIPYVTSQQAGYDRSLLRPAYLRFAPRFGFAWTPFGGDRTVIRSGFGLFFNQAAYSIQTSLMKNLPFYFNKQVTTSNDALMPAYTTTSILNAPNTGTIGGSAMDQNYRSEYAESWDFSLQHQLRNNWVIEASYFGSKVVGADNVTYQNIPTPGPGSVQQRRPNPNISGYPLVYWGGWSTYHSLTLKLTKRLSYGLTINANYTWSKAIDNASSPGPTDAETNYPQNVNYRRAEKALSSYNRAHRFVFSFSYAIPSGVGTLIREGSIPGLLLSNWSLTGTSTLQSGAPFTVNLPGDNANIGPGPAQRPDLITNPNLPASQQTPDHWFNTAAFAMPAQYTFGNAGRNIVFGDGYINTDMALAKRTALSERYNLEFRAEFFNLFNNTNFMGAPGRIAFTPSFGRYFQAYNPRQIQLALRLRF